ncbi:hypothetical protein [Blastomonas sp.]|uniref:hypothetical protein n=1 Tax=Blastomonas sp. TaxID=1909299 RepID=UPI00391A01FD
MTFSTWVRYGLAAAFASASGALILQKNRAAANHDAAPARTARHAGRFGDYRVAGATVTIQATPEQIVEAWRSLPELWSAMEYLPFPEGNQPGQLLPSDSLREMAGKPLMLRLIDSQDDGLLVWRSEGPEYADMHGRIRLTDNSGKGTAVEAVMAVKPGDFRQGLQTDAMLETKVEKGLLRDLRRIRMLVETGEIATARYADRRDEA